MSASSSRSHNAVACLPPSAASPNMSDPKDVDSHDSHSNEIGVPLIEVFSVVHIADDRKAGDREPSYGYIQVKDDKGCQELAKLKFSTSEDGSVKAEPIPYCNNEVVLTVKGPTSSLENVSLIVGLNYGVYNYGYNTNLNVDGPFENGVAVRESIIRPTPAGKELISVMYGIFKTATAAKIKIRLYQFDVINLDKFLPNSSASIFGVVTACSSRKDLDCETCTSILFVKESDNKSSTDDDGFIVLSKSGVAVPLGSDLIIDFTLFIGGVHYEDHVRIRAKESNSDTLCVAVSLDDIVEITIDWIVDPISLRAFYDTDFASSTSSSSSGSDPDSSNGSDSDFSNGSDSDFSNRSDDDSKKHSSPKRDPEEVTYTGSSSAEAMEISDSVMIFEYREAPFEVLVKIGQLKDYLYKYLLLQHATGEGKGSSNRSVAVEQKANHLALSHYLDNDRAYKTEQSASVVGDKTTELKTVSDIVYEDNTGELKKEWIHVPATLKRKDCFSFCLTVEEDKDQQVADHNLERYYTIDHVIFDKVDSVVSGNSRKEKGLDQNEPGNIWPLVFSRAQNQQPLLSGLTTFNRINVLASSDPLTGLYMCSNGYLVTEGIQFTHEIGQGKDDEIEEPSKIESCDYVEAVRLTGYPDVPAGKVVFRGKVWNKYKLPPVFALKKTFGGVARYKGRGRQTGFQNSHWVSKYHVLRLLKKPSLLCFRKSH